MIVIVPTVPGGQEEETRLIHGPGARLLKAAKTIVRPMATVDMLKKHSRETLMSAGYDVPMDPEPSIHAIGWHYESDEQAPQPKPQPDAVTNIFEM